MRTIIHSDFQFNWPEITITLHLPHWANLIRLFILGATFFIWFSLVYDIKSKHRKLKRHLQKLMESYFRYFERKHFLTLYICWRPRWVYVNSKNDESYDSKRDLQSMVVITNYEHVRKTPQTFIYFLTFQVKMHSVLSTSYFTYK